MKPINRKEFLKRAGVGLISGPFILSGLDKLTSESLQASPKPPFDCVLQPVHTGGPFYLDPEYDRLDISEGRPGLPLQVRFKVLGVQNCEPVPDAVVNLWHCDHRGVYSQFSTAQGNPEDGTDGSYFRGYRQTNQAGECVFETKFPGWYPGRATHFHFDVHLGFMPGGEIDGSKDPSSTFLSQMYVPDALKTLVYTEIDDYADYGDNPVDLTTDGLFNNAQSLMMTFDSSDYPNSLTADFCIGLDMLGTGTSIQIGEGKQYFELGQNFPNPCSSTTDISFSLKESGMVTLSVFNPAGELVEQLVHRQLRAGEYNVQFDRNQAKDDLPAGNYLFEMTLRNAKGRFRQSRMMMIIDSDY